MTPSPTSAPAASRTHFVTGVTGFVGGALVLRLLRSNPTDQAFCLIRAADDHAAANRLIDALHKAGTCYGISAAEVEALCARAIAVRGDLTAADLGLDDHRRALLRGAGPLHVWHCAASLKDDEPNFAEIIAHNVTGTERVLETLLDLNVAVFNHVSTAYVAGRRQGTVRESIDRPRGFSNRYEQSKYYGEMLVIDHCDRARVPFRILRPAIVIADSVTGAATGYTGFMGWILKVAALAELSRGALRHQVLQYVARPDARINVIPIDSIVEDCDGIDRAGAATHDQVFHLTNTQPPTVKWLCDITARTLGLAGIECVDTDEASLDPLSARFHRWTRFERPYVSLQRDFDRTSNRLYESPRHGACSISDPLMQRMIRLAVADYQQQTRNAHPQQKQRVA